MRAESQRLDVFIKLLMTNFSDQIFAVQLKHTRAHVSAQTHTEDMLQSLSLTLTLQQEARLTPGGASLQRPHISQINSKINK